MVLASDVAVLSKPNGSIRLMANRPCGNSADGGDGARGTLPPDAVARPLCRLAVVTVVSARGAIGPSVVACPARGDDRAAAVGWGDADHASSWAGKHGGEAIVGPLITWA